MPTYNLIIREHEEYGDPGIALEERPEYFEPALNGSIVAHDIVEHFSNSHENGYIDEFMAIGSVIAGRISYGWTNNFGRTFSYNVIHIDVSNLVMNSIWQDDDWMKFSCNSYIQDKAEMEAIRENVKSGIIEGYCEAEVEVPDNLDVMVRNITGWICKGIQKFNKRFENKYRVSISIFTSIEKVCNNFLMESDYEGMRAKLYVNFTTGKVNLTPQWEWM